jgi:hypothetical protein
VIADAAEPGFVESALLAIGMPWRLRIALRNLKCKQCGMGDAWPFSTPKPQAEKRTASRGSVCQ